MTGWERILYFFGGMPKRSQFTFCYCPGCRLDLVSRVDGPDGTTVSDTDLVRYICGNCGTRSIWNFDIAPAPIYVGNVDG